MNLKQYKITQLNTYNLRITLSVSKQSANIESCKTVTLN